MPGLIQFSGQFRWLSATMTGLYEQCLGASGAYKWYINGEWKESSSGKTVKILNPSTNDTAFEVQGEQCSKQESFSRSCGWLGCVCKHQ